VKARGSIPLLLACACDVAAQGELPQPDEIPNQVEV